MGRPSWAGEQVARIQKIRRPASLEEGQVPRVRKIRRPPSWVVEVVVSWLVRVPQRSWVQKTHLLFVTIVVVGEGGEG